MNIPRVRRRKTPLLKMIPKSDLSGPSSPTKSSRNITKCVHKRFYLGLGAAFLIASLLPVALSYELNHLNNKESSELKRKLEASDEFQIKTPVTIRDDPILEFPLGKILPVIRQSRDGRNFYAFYKVPYAKPPIGNLRFELPERVEPWTGIRNETQVAPQCIQKVKYSAINETAGEEDCLYMNIYSHHIPEDVYNDEELKPTLVYFHGGASQGNGSRYGPDYFMDENVVLITLQFRTAAFGHLSVAGSHITGNMGSKDQVFALKWVQEYARYFGGDPKNVMIFGNSYGGMHTGLHLFSPMSTGLFHRAIMQSGNTIFNNQLVDPNPEASTRNLARETNCPYSSPSVLISCLKNVNASDLALILVPEIKYGTVFEVDDGTGNAFLSDYPLNLYRQGKFNRASVMIGVLSAEGLNLFDSLATLRSTETTELANSNWASYAPTLLNYKTSDPDPNYLAYKLKQNYFGNSRIEFATNRNLTNMVTDRFITHATHVEGTFHSTVNPVYLYFLARQPAKSYAEPVLEMGGFPSPSEYYYGPTHADELQFMFPYEGYPYIGQGSEYYNFSKLVVNLWSNFAASGVPGQDWKPFSPKDKLLEWYLIDEQPRMIDFLVPRMSFWDQFSFEELGYELTSESNIPNLNLSLL